MRLSLIGFLLLLPLSASAPRAPQLIDCQWEAWEAIQSRSDYSTDAAWQMDTRAELAATGPLCDTLCLCMHYDTQFPTIWGGTVL